MDEQLSVPNDSTENTSIHGQHSFSIGEHEFMILLTPERELFLSIPDLCEALRINKPSQVRRIQRSDDLRPGLRSIQIQTRGGKQRINCLRSDYIPLWLSGIHTAPSQRIKRLEIEQFQQELFQALHAIFQAATYETAPTSDRQDNDAHLQKIAQSLDWRSNEMPRMQLEEEQDLLTSDQRMQIVLSQLPDSSVESHLTVTSYPEDRAIREATLAQTRRWRQGPGSLTYRYAASNKLDVYLGDPDSPLEIPDALENIQKLGESTALTARIILGLWTIRHADEHLSHNGSAAVRVDEILEWRGVKKHSHVAYKGSEKRHSDGYQASQRHQVYEDLKLLSQCYLRGHYSMVIQGRPHRILIDGPYLRVSAVKEQTLWEEETIGFFVSPGDWINAYQRHEIYFFAEVDRRVFALHPQNEQHELRLALFLTERWRQQAKQRNYDEPIKMSDLLAASMIPVDTSNLTNRFVPRITTALSNLYTRGILGAEPQCLTEIDRSKSHWGKEWLSSKWCLLPPLDLVQHYALHSRKQRLLPNKRELPWSEE